MESGFKLQVSTIAINSLKMAWRDKKIFFNTISLPSLFLVLCYALSLNYAKNIGFPVIIIITGIIGVGLSWFAIICYRLILITNFNVFKELDFNMMVRATRFLVLILQVFIVMWFIEVVATITISNIFHKNLPSPSDGLDDISFWIKLLSEGLSLYVLGRISLVFPATAIDKKVSLKWSWVITQGNGWNMFVIVALFPLPFSFLINFIWSKNATNLESAVLSIASFFVFIIEIFALSLTYREFESYYVDR